MRPILRNMGDSDRNVRITIAVTLSFLYFTNLIEGRLGLILLAIAINCWLTSMMAWSLIYYLLNRSTKPKEDPFAEQLIEGPNVFPIFGHSNYLGTNIPHSGMIAPFIQRFRILVLSVSLLSISICLQAQNRPVMEFSTAVSPTYNLEASEIQPSFVTMPITMY